MSRIGKLPIPLPDGVKVEMFPKTNLVTVQGKLGKLFQQVDPKITMSRLKDKNLDCSQP